MKISELRALDDASLKEQLNKIQKELFDLRFQRAAGKLPNFNRLGQLRRDIARVKTLLHERESIAVMEAKK